MVRTVFHLLYTLWNQAVNGLEVTLASLLSGENEDIGYLKAHDCYNSHEHIAANTNTICSAGPAVLGGVSVNTVGTTSTLTVYHGVDATGELLGILDTTALTNGIRSMPKECPNGIYVVPAGAAAADLSIYFDE